MQANFVTDGDTQRELRQERALKTVCDNLFSQKNIHTPHDFDCFLAKELVSGVLLLNQHYVLDWIERASQENIAIYLSVAPVDKTMRHLNLGRIDTLFLSPRDLHQLVGLIDQNVALNFLLDRFPKLNLIICDINSTTFKSNDKHHTLENPTKFTLSKSQFITDYNDIFAAYYCGLMQSQSDTKLLLRSAMSATNDAVERLIQDGHLG